MDCAKLSLLMSWVIFSFSLLPIYMAMVECEIDRLEV